MKKILTLCFCLCFALLMTGCGAEKTENNPQAAEAVQDMKEINLNEQIPAEFKHGQLVIFSGEVDGGNGKAGNRVFQTGNGPCGGRPTCVTLNKETYLSVWFYLRDPSLDSLYEKKVTIKGKIDMKNEDPGAPDFDPKKNIIVSDAELIEVK